MITRYVLGTPLITDSVVVEMPVTEGPCPYWTAEGFRIDLEETDIVAGLGEQVRGMNKRGWKYTSYNLDNCHHQEDTTSLYGAHNFIMISGQTVWGLFFDYAGRMNYDVGYTRHDRLQITADEYDMNVYVITGEDEAAVVKQLRQLTGRSYMAPKWGLGYGQSRWGYKSAEDIRAVVRNYRDRKIPLDSVYVDIDYMEAYKDFTINEENFPDFPAFCAEMAEQGIHLVPIIDAGVKIEPGYDVYEEGVKGNYFCKDAEGKDFVAAVWPGRVHFPDMLNDEARRWFGDKYAFLLDQGIDGFWNDMNEPSVFYTDKRLQQVIERIVELGKMNIGIQEYFELQGSVNSISHHPEDHKEFFHRYHGQMVRHDKVHNLFGGSMTKAADEAFRRLRPEQRILMFSRSSYIGAHRYGGIWQGDNNSWWSHLLMNVQMTASLNMTGFIFTGADLGGFNCDVTEDLLVRWLQWSVFTPLMRNHSCMGTREQEVYRFDNWEDSRRLISLRYSLLPYLYSEYMKAVLEDRTMIRPLWFDYHDELSRHVEDQVLLGDELMIAPVYVQNAIGRYVYLPEAMTEVRLKSWEDVRMTELPQGHHYIPYGCDELVFFVRQGKAVPLCAGGQCVADLACDEFRLVGTPGSTYALYEDDGVSRTIHENDRRVLR